MSKHLVHCIAEKSFAEAQNLFNEYMEALAERKMIEKKKMIMAREFVEDKTRKVLK
jgi:hypothetical protein